MEQISSSLIAIVCFLVASPAYSVQSSTQSGPGTPTAASAQDRSTSKPLVSLILNESKTLIDQGRLDDAIQNLHELQVAQPAVKGVNHELGIAYFRKGEFVQAVNAFAKAMEEDPEDREAAQLRGLSLFQLGRPAEAIPYLKQVQSWIGPANVDANYVLGLCYMHTQNYEEARRSFAQMYGVAQDSAPAHLFLARMLLRQGYDPIAEQNAQQAAAMDARCHCYWSLHPHGQGPDQKEGLRVGYHLSPEGITHGPIELHVTSFDGRSVSRSWAHRGRGTGIEKIRGTSVGSGIEASGINQVIGYGGQVTGRR
ncbi:MAG: hypothetical protein DMG63_07250 [Acidobacteria bacterium]|nr:MAG: hypothetical protein DMG63_07250 [Acidobacteriota bacterium]